MTRPDTPFSPEPNVNRDIWLVVLGTVALSTIIAIVMSYAP
ncbi:MAG TPA: hypothetical protein V6D00_15185 [Pantanalinema sp.]